MFPRASGLLLGLLAGLLEVLDKLRNVVIAVVLLSGGVLLSSGERLGYLLQVGETVRSELVNDTGEQFLKRLLLVTAADHVGVGSDVRLNLGVLEVDDLSVFLEEIDLLDGRNVIHPEALKRALKTLVVRGSRFAALLLSANTTFSSRTRVLTELAGKLSARGDDGWIRIHICT